MPYYDYNVLEMDYEDYTPQGRTGTAGKQHYHHQQQQQQHRQQQQQQQHQPQLQNKKVSQDFSTLYGNENGGGVCSEMTH